MSRPLDFQALVVRLQQRGCPAPRVLWFPEVGSTQDEAIALGRRGAPAGTLVMAGRQTRGRGRQGRSWHSPEGGLYCSLLLRPEAPVHRWPSLTVVAGLAVARALTRSGVVGVRIKWPNDLILGGRKVAGLLAESVATEGFCVVGVGLNLDLGDGLPPDLRAIATDLAREAPGTHPLDVVTEVVLEVVGCLLGASRDPQVDSQEIDVLLDRDREVQIGDLRGRPEGVEPGGELRLRASDGTLHRVRCGEVVRADRD
ncbi:MAG TPA: biotin--[acetyl-CoA-carboxylase] ligase [Myxococcota bacterium]|nr:biotin--[acetyl-CoA-carboxylase] ligase [Myxococcota bacterium]HQK50665.1 biotin--[acetyl-CoA-carboxylase] ligase [Myxococcota bacterium]